MPYQKLEVMRMLMSTRALTFYSRERALISGHCSRLAELWTESKRSIALSPAKTLLLICRGWCGQNIDDEGNRLISMWETLRQRRRGDSECCAKKAATGYAVVQPLKV